MAMTPQQEAQYVLSYGSRDDCTSDDARAEFDRLKAAAAPQASPLRVAASSQKEPSPAKGKELAVSSASLGMAVLVLIAGIILQVVSGAKAGLCNTVIGQFAQEQSSGAMVHCGLWTGLDTFGQIFTWLGCIGIIGMVLLLGLAWLAKPK